MAWRFLSLCASLSFLGRHLVLAACWQRGLRRAQVRGPRFPCPGVSVSRYRRIPAGLSRAGRRGSLILSPWAVLGRSPRRGRASDPLVRGLPWLAGPRLSRGAAVTRAWRDEPCSPPAPRALGCPPSRPEPLLRRPAGSLSPCSHPRLAPGRSRHKAQTPPSCRGSLGTRGAENRDSLLLLEGLRCFFTHCGFSGLSAFKCPAYPVGEALD